MPIRHTFVSAIPDDPAAAAAGDVLTQSHWNADHDGDHDPVTVGTGLDVTGQLVELDLSEVAAGGELAGFLDAPTVDATHSGSTHAATQASAEATASGALSSHAGAADPHTGYVREADANWIDLTDAGATTLHSHAGGGVEILEASGNTWAALTPVALGYRIDQPGVNLSFLVWEVTDAGTTGASEPDWEAVPLATGPITDASVEWTFQGYVGKVIGAQSIESSPDGGGSGSSILTEDAVAGVAGDLYIRGGHGAAAEPGGTIGLQGGKGDAGVTPGAFMYVRGGEAAGVGGNIEMYGGDGALGGGPVYIASGYGIEPGASGGTLTFDAADSDDGNEGGILEFLGGQEGAGGGPVLFQGGDAQGGLPGGDVTLAGGEGDSGDDAEARMVVQGGRGDGNAGRVAITTNGNVGDAGEALVSDGAGAVVWSSLITVQAGTPVAGGFQTVLVFDSTATTGGLYAWTGADYELIGLATS